METIRNYLESMFASLPNTPEVLKAKHELGQMMEDKYTRLCEEGRAENEAIAIVISEFGNLDELADTLGLADVLHGHTPDNVPTASIDEIRAYLSDASHTGFLQGLGVLLCICCPVFCCIGAAIDNNFALALGTVSLFLTIAAGVGLFVYNSIHMRKWSDIREQRRRIDYATAAYISEQRDAYRSTHALYTAIGVILCIISVVPVAAAGILNEENELLMGFTSALIFILVGIGVLLLVTSNIRSGLYTQLLRLNSADTVAGTYQRADDKDGTWYENRTVAGIMSIYWPTVTCIYLIISFLTFAWGITWIIWPVAAIVETLIKHLFGSEVPR